MRSPLDPKRRPSTLVAWLWFVAAVLVLVVAAGSVVARISCGFS